jgi:hypothetical protein
MALHPGERVVPIEVVDAIGAGGMGEVCRGRDTSGQTIRVLTNWHERIK